MKKPKAILILDNSFTFGGAINSLYHLLRALNKDRFVPVLVTGQPHAFIEEHFADCICHRYVPKLPWVDNRIYLRLASLSIFQVWPLKKLLNLGRFAYWLLFVTVPEAVRYYRLGRRHEVALVHLNNILGSQLAGIIAAKLLRVPCVAHLRDFEEIHPVTRFYAWLIDHHVAISGAIRDNLLQLGVPDEKITVVHDAIDLQEFNANIDCRYLLREFSLEAGQLRFGIFGRVVKWKGIREFILAVQHVIKTVPDAQGFVVGGLSDGDEAFLAEMKQLVEALGLQKNVLFTGYRKDVPALMQLMDVVVHASIRPEPFGMVVIEGMALGKPVVATRGGGPLDIVVDQQTGILVEMGDLQALGEAVAELLGDAAKRESMGRLGRSRVEALFANELYARRMEAVYSSFLD